MAKLDVLVSADKITFVDSKGKAESLDLFDVMDDGDAVRSINTELKAAHSASKAAVSLLSHILDNPRLDGYRGVTPSNEAVPAELKAAIRELETEYLKPIFCAPHEAKGAKPATVESLWQAFAGDLKAGGSYAVAKSFVTMYFAYVGKLPVADNGKLFSVAAIKKLVANAKADVVSTPKTFTDKLMALAHELDTRSESFEFGNTASAIATLRSMLATAEGLAREDAEAAQVTHELTIVGDVAALAIAKASDSSSIFTADDMEQLRALM